MVFWRGSDGQLKIDHGVWVVVCDGAKALVLENAGNRKTPNLKTKEVYEHDDPKTREIGTDEPGRSFSSVGNGRSAMEQTDWHDQEEQRFLAKLAARLDKAVLGGETPSLDRGGAAARHRRAAAASSRRMCGRPSAPRSRRITSRCRSTRSRGISIQ